MAGVVGGWNDRSLIKVDPLGDSTRNQAIGRGGNFASDHAHDSEVDFHGSTNSSSQYGTWYCC